MEHKTYTEKEIQHNIDTLNKRVDDLKLSRTEISQEINQVKKQVVAWEELDDSQFKMF
jgi:prefoldin subunit 5|tara:strand:+ start:2364 stop:2537 length:174 start_codon:yes stop_codon:yes gene_type:complete